MVQRNIEIPEGEMKIHKETRWIGKDEEMEEEERCGEMYKTQGREGGCLRRREETGEEKTGRYWTNRRRRKRRRRRRKRRKRRQR